MYSFSFDLNSIPVYYQTIKLKVSHLSFGLFGNCLKSIVIIIHQPKRFFGLLFRCYIFVHHACILWSEFIVSNFTNANDKCIICLNHTFAYGLSYTTHVDFLAYPYAYAWLYVSQKPKHREHKTYSLSWWLEPMEKYVQIYQAHYLRAAKFHTILSSKWKTFANFCSPNAERDKY